MTVRQLENLLHVPVFVFSGQWDAVFAALGGSRNGAAHTSGRSKTQVTYPVRGKVRI
jgi:hypothetical protein